MLRTNPRPVDLPAAQQWYRILEQAQQVEGQPVATESQYRALAEEAQYGKIKALRSLGRAAAAKTEIEAFLAAYPNSAYADDLNRK